MSSSTLSEAGLNGHTPIANKLIAEAPKTSEVQPQEKPRVILTNGHLNGHLSVADRTPDYQSPTTNTYASKVQMPAALSHSSSAHAPLAQDELPIAVIGMACRLPGGSSSPDKLWDMLAKGKSGWSKIPSERFIQSSFEHPSSSVSGTSNSKGAHFLEEDVSLFDAAAFNISPLEAKAMDPQMRLQLEVTYEALESGGITLEKIAGSKTAVYIGVFSDDYSTMMLSDPETLPPHHVTGTGKAIFANRGLGFLSDEGRCFSFDSRGAGYGRGEGVTSVVLKPLKHAIADGDPIRAVIRSTVVNQDGKTPGITMPSCKAQTALIDDAYAQARLDPADTQYVEAHGTGTNVGDPIEVEAIANVLSRTRGPSNPLIVGSVKANIGHLETASGLAGLIKVILCLEKGLIPPSINFENENQDLLLNERHLKIAKTLLPWPSGNVRRASLNSFGYGGTNAHAILDAYSCDTPTDNAGQVQFQSAAVTTNGHSDELSRRIFLLSHRTKPGLQRLAENLRQYIESSPPFAGQGTLDDIAHTITSRRTTFNWRCAVVAASQQELCDALQPSCLEMRGVLQNSRLAFIFTGQGAQWHAMGRELIDRYEMFGSTLRAADRHLTSLGASWSVIDEIKKDAASSRLQSASIGQPACVAIQCALVDLLSSWNVRPSSVAGHSSGEIAAAYACGSITLESALTVAYHQGFLSSMHLEKNSKLRGGMLAVGLSETDVAGYLDQIPSSSGKAVVACVNSPRSVTLSGDRSAIVSVQSMLEARQIFVRKLGVSTAYHSHHMEIVAPSYLSVLDQQLPSPRSNKDIQFYSSVTGELIDGSSLDAAYWVKNMVSQVKFAQSLERLYQASSTSAPGEHTNLGTSTTQLLLEIGPHSALAGPIKQTLNSKPEPNFRYIGTLIRGKNAVDTLLNAASDLAVAGSEINLEAVNFQEGTYTPRVLSDLPLYPWIHNTSYWHESRVSLDYRKRSAPRHPLLGAPSSDLNRLEPSWRNIIRLTEIPWLSGHVVQSSIVYPAAGYIAMAIEAISQHCHLVRPAKEISRYTLKSISIGKPLLIPDTSEGIETQFVLRPYNASSRKSSDVWDEFRIFSYSKSDGWSEHCRGLIQAEYHKGRSEVEQDRETQFKVAKRAQTLAEAEESCQSVAHPVKIYDSLRQLGLQFQDAFCCIEDVRVGTRQSLGHIRIPNTALVMPRGIEHPHVLHPATLDACMQMTSPILLDVGALQVLMVPTFIERISISNNVPRQAGERLGVHTDLQQVAKRSFKARITAGSEFADKSELPSIEIDGLVCIAIPGGSSSNKQSDGADGKCHMLKWVPALDCVYETPRDPQATAPLEAKVAEFPQVSLVYQADLAMKSGSIISTLSVLLGSKLARTYSNFEELAQASCESTLCICLADVGGLTSDLTEPLWFALQKLLSSANNILWVTQGGAMDVTFPQAGLITGLARTARLENAALRLVTLDIDPTQGSFDKTAEAILSVVDRAFVSKDEESLDDVEFVERAGEIYNPRVIEDEPLQKHLMSGITELETEDQPFIQPSRPLLLDVASPGLLDSLRFIEDSSAQAPPAANQLKMQPRCFGVNFRDVMIALGQLEDTSLMSSEHSGIVTEVGGDLTESFKVGDRICAWGGKAYASSVTVDGVAAQHIPETMSFEAAASIPVVYATVYYGLIHLARLQKGETVFIQSAAGGVGQAAIMLAKYVEAEIFVTVGSNEKKALVMSTYGIQEDHIFSSRQLSFGAGIERLTGGKGVDVVLNSIAGEGLQESFNCLGKLGRFIEIGKRDILDGTRLDMGQFGKSVTFASVDLTIVFQHDPSLAKRMMGEVFALLEKGALQPVQPLNVFPISDIESAFRLIQAGKHTGKVVLKAEEDTIVKALPAAPTNVEFDQDASYIIVGGLGGLGQAICRWMAGRGCKHIVALSRSGMNSANAISLKGELETTGVKLVAYACDVGNAQEVEQDNILNNMSHEDYHAALAPKVAGTINLHRALSNYPQLSFFLTLSSCVGIIGNAGQANYAAGCTFQDAFARHQYTQQKPPRTPTITRSLDIGMVAGAGYVHDNPAVLRFLTAQGFRAVTLEELFSAIEYAITTPIRDVDECQLILGLGASGQIPQYYSDAKFESLRNNTTSSQAPDSGSTTDLRGRLALPSSITEKQDIIREAVMAQVSKILVVPQEDLDPGMTFSHYGGDSLAAVEMRSWISGSLGVNVGVMEVLSGGSLEALVSVIGGRLGGGKDGEGEGEGEGKEDGEDGEGK